MKIVVLDFNTVSYGDVDFSSIERLGEVIYYNKVEEDEIVPLCKGADAVLVNKAEMTRDIISALPDLKYIGAFATGYNNVDIKACNDFNVTCCNAPSYSTNAVAQHAIALMLMSAGSVNEYSESVKRGDWIKSSAFSYYIYPQYEVFDKTFGVFGYGEIGKATAKIADALGMKVIVYSRRREKDCPYEYVEFDELFKRSDFLSLHCPLNEGTKGVINERTLSLMKSSATLINTARGGLIDENALKNALEEGRLRAACLDVIVKEPMSENCPLFNVKNCIITPHVAWASVETRQRLVELVAENLKKFIEGNPQNVIK